MKDEVPRIATSLSAAEHGHKRVSLKAEKHNRARAEKMKKYPCWDCCLYEQCNPRKPCQRYEK